MLSIGDELCTLSLPSLCENGRNGYILVEIHVIQTGYELRGISFKLLYVSNYKKKYLKNNDKLEVVHFIGGG